MDFQEHVFRKVQQILLLGGSSASAQKVCFEDLSEDVFPEVRNEKCGELLCLLGYIARGVHLRNNIFVPRKPTNGPERTAQWLVMMHHEDES